MRGRLVGTCEADHAITGNTVVVDATTVFEDPLTSDDVEAEVIDFPAPTKEVAPAA